ncbi:MAG: aminotransferase class I/II-fold pyridoxal phosphate-dependent enzyme, partial [Victivallales bacterium]|nr:aminotransferase class I/II-fold pyridoxal phosphate-dependent enzyme [Victivallales bacterium]
MKQQHGGNRIHLAAQAGCQPEELLDFSISINPLGPPEPLHRAVCRAWDHIDRYPEPRAASLIAAAAKHYLLPEHALLAGNGANQLIFALTAALHPRRVVIAVPAYGDYFRSCRNIDAEIITVMAPEEHNFIPDAAILAAAATPGTMVFIGHPGNPAGTAMTPDAIRTLAGHCPEAIFVIDEAFADFIGPGFSLLPELPPNMIVLRSLTKFYAIAGLRVGLLAAAPDLIARIAPRLPDWSVNTMAIAAGRTALTMGESFAATTRSSVAALKTRLAGQLTACGLKVYPGQANYLLVRHSWEIADLPVRLLREYRIAVRDCRDFTGLDHRYFRIGLREEADND